MMAVLATLSTLVTQYSVEEGHEDSQLHRDPRQVDLQASSRSGKKQLSFQNQKAEQMKTI